MKKSTKAMIVSLAAVMAISAGAVFAADNTKSTSKTAKAPVSAVAKLKLTQDDATKVALNAHKDAKVVSVQLNGKIYIVKISDIKGNRTLEIGGNTGKILKDVSDTAPVAAKPAATKTAKK